jgi:DnaJ-like protein
MPLTRDEALARLGLPTTALLADVRERFRRLALAHHPDRFFTPADKHAATLRFQSLAEAYSFLLHAGDPTKAETTPPATSPAGSHRRWRPPTRQTASLTAFDMLGIVEDRWPALHAILDPLGGVLILPMSVVTFPLIIFGGILERSPRLNSLVWAFATRWAPPLGAAWLGVRLIERHSPWGAALFLAAAAAYAALEITAQVISLHKLHAARSALAVAFTATDYRDNFSLSAFRHMRAP